MSRDAPTGWEGVLNDGERIIWQGRPRRGLYLPRRKAVLFFAGLGITGYALWWTVLVAQDGGTFWRYGLIHLAIGLHFSFGTLIWEHLKTRRTWYTVTTQRAFIARKLPLLGQRLDPYDITPETRLHYTPGKPATIYFASEVRDRGDRSPVTIHTGFERIMDGQAAFDALRDIQEAGA